MSNAQRLIKSDPAPARRRYERYFVSAMATLILATVFLGFAKSYFLAGMFWAPLPHWVIHVHGAAFTLFIFLLILQTRSFRRGAWIPVGGFLARALPINM